MAHWKPKAASASKNSLPTLTRSDRAALLLLISLVTPLLMWLGSQSAPAVEPLPDYRVWINVNTASREELEELPGIGPVLAQRIIDRREAFGPLTSLEELLEIRGIGPVSVEQLRPWVTFGQEFLKK